jgi:uncharacterized protein
MEARKVTSTADSRVNPHSQQVQSPTLTTAILKLTSVCNLDCSYCYMFNLTDKTFERVPNRMPVSIALRSVDRIEEYCATRGLDTFSLSLHGGEPTLWPTASFAALFSRVQRARDNGLDLRLSMQTNGLRLRPKLVDLLLEYKVSLGVSLDGPQQINDRVRIDHAGRGSYERIMRMLDALVKRGVAGIVQGFLSVCQPEIDPDEFLQWADQLPIRALDVLWPLEFNHDNPPWSNIGLERYRKAPIYGTWMADLFELWFRRDDPTLFIRSFYHVLEIGLGSKRYTDTLVNSTITLFIVNTDGGLEYSDYLRSYTDGGTRSSFNVVQNSLDEFCTDPMVEFLLQLGNHLPSECHPCPVRDVCGGGHLAGRGANSQPFPVMRSVLCYDEFHFFSRINQLVQATSDRPAWNPPLMASQLSLPSSVNTRQLVALSAGRTLDVAKSRT